MKIGKQSWMFNQGVYIQSSATVTGPKEKQGPLGQTYDYSFDELHCNEDSWEKAEQALLKKSIKICMENTNVREDAIDLFISGDLLNQNVTSNYVARDLPSSFLCVFGACSTSMETLAIGSSLIDSGNCKNVLASTSSHYSTAERQFRYPTEYGGQKPDTSTTTVTGAGTVLINNEASEVQVEGATIGKVIDYGMDDPLDMGSAMAPAAADTIVQHLKDFNRKPEDYDLILTGDLSSVGTPIVKKMTEQSGYDIEGIHRDCGLMVYHSNQQVFAGGSGCASSAVVTYGYILQQLKENKLKKVLICATGTLLSPTMTQQKETIPCIAHGVVLKRADA
ncbi:stage V sporulation protein AD [Tenuibacillus multivorans]|uniref:Stage V sporulation protein AD n=1 Tax=Tenuibacillus multivorans TaxID=237069 RepID=A0A1H0CZ60_9BACI|nr:stage V sporulation protein AD [Tenuibacillus multivorans]GEL76107.1 stage V sporulation protein AD [Tenuibacillus multivorans]SDN63184.1 stage V sporulation protein AD [Tenuibacillus multivorans]